MKKIYSATITLLVIASIMVFLPGFGSNTVVAIEHPTSFKLLQNENKTVIPIVNITLANDTIFNFTTIDDAMEFLYDKIGGNEITFNDIRNITLLYFDDFLKAKENITNATIRPIPAYKSFFSYIKSPEDYNYSGLIIPIREEQIIESGGILTRNILYGKLGSVEFQDLNGTLHMLNESEITIFIFINSSNTDATSQYIEQIQMNLDNFTSLNTQVVVVDINNNETLAREFSVINNLTLTIVLDNKTYLSTLNQSGLYDVLGFSRLVPASVYVDRNGWVLRKTIGVESVDSMLIYLSLMKQGIQGLANYPIVDVYIENPREDTTSDIVVVLGDGFGSIYEVTVTYTFVFNNDTLSENTTIELKSTDNIVFRNTIYVPNDTRLVVINATVISQYGNYTIQTLITIEQVEEQKKGGGYPIELIIMMISIIIVLGIGIYYSQKIKK